MAACRFTVQTCFHPALLLCGIYSTGSPGSCVVRLVTQRITGNNVRGMALTCRSWLV